MDAAEGTGTVMPPRASDAGRTPLHAEDSAIARQRRRIDFARTILTMRRKRHALFPGARLGEPSWDMMLDLYVADGIGRQVDVSGLCLAAGAPTTTALRHIETLVEHGYILRRSDLRDGRRTIVIAAEPLRTAIDAWLDLHLAEIDFGAGQAG